MYETIVVGYDGSPAAREAVDHAVGLAGESGGKIIIAWGVEFSKMPRATAAMKPIVDEAIREAEEAVQQVVDGCKDVCSLVSAVIIPRPPVDALLEAAKDAAADLIVVGTKGQRGLASGFMGSTAYGLVHRSHIPVLLIPID